MPTGITTTPTEIILEDDWITYTLSTSGLSKALKINSSGVNLVPPTPAEFSICKTEQNGIPRYHLSNRIEFTSSPTPSEGILTVTFAGKIKARLAVRAHPAYILFQLLDVTQIPAGRTLLELNFIDLLLTGDSYSSPIGAIYYHDFMVTTTVLNPQVDTIIHPKSGLYESSALYRAPENISTAQAVLWGAPKERWLQLMSDLEVQFNLPHPLVGSAWLKQHAKLKASYLFVTLSASNADYVIDIAQKAGIEYILIRGYSWCQSAGSYPINRIHFPAIPGSPDDWSGLKQVIDKIHRSGLRVGLHTFSFAIDKDDPYVVPSPHPDLAKEAPVRLVAPIGIHDTVILVELTLDEKNEYDFFVNEGELDILVGNEIMRLMVSPTAALPHYEIQVDRITPLSQRIPHPASEILYHLPEFYNKYLPAFGSDLCVEIAERIALLVREMGVDFVYLDSHEGMTEIQPIDWYARNFATLTFYNRFPQGVLLQTSSFKENYQWHMVSRGSSDDRAWIGVKSYLDNHKINGYTSDYQKAFMAQELGWVGVQTSNSEDDSFYSTTLDELEVYLNRSLGFDLPIGFETEIETLEQNHLTEHACEMIKQYETLRKIGYFSPAFRAFLQQPGREFHLIKDTNGVYGFHERVFKSHCVKNSAGESWLVKNDFQIQKLNFKITALRKPNNYDSPNNVVLAMMDLVSEFPEKLRNGDPNCSLLLSAITSGGTHYLQLTITNTSETEMGWVLLKKKLYSPIDLSKHKAIGVNVLGDNQHQAIAVQLSSSASENAVSRQYQFDVDFNGWVYRELLLPSTDELYKYPYEENPSLSRTLKRSFLDFNYKKVDSLSIYIKNIPPGETKITLGQIKALHQDDFILRNPSVQIGPHTLTMLTDLNPGEYLMNEGTTVSKFDRRHRPIADVPVNGSWPVLEKGNNSIRFCSDISSSTYSNKALMEVRMEGSPFFRGDYCIWYSPLEFLAPTDSHLVLEKGKVGSGIRVRSSQAGDLQWLLMGLNLTSGTTVRGIVLNYRCSTANSFISQVRLTSTRLPPTALVVHDDPTDLKSTIATVYQSVVANRITDGVITLELRLNYANTTDSIDFGAIGFLLNT